MVKRLFGMEETMVRFHLGAPLSAFGEMDIMLGFEPSGGSSILSGSTIL